MFPTLALQDDGSWLSAYRIVAPWNLDGTVDVPVVVEVDGLQSTHILRLAFDAAEPTTTSIDVKVTPEMMGRLLLIRRVEPDGSSTAH